jgi:uncharacterized membrane protein
MTLLFVLIAAFAIIPLWVRSNVMRRELQQLRERLARLEREAAERGAGLVAVPPPVATPPPLPPPLPLERTLSPELATAGPATMEAAQVHTPLPTPITRDGDGSALEQMVGGVWLQNVGAVLVLLGVFFLILWGYTSGHLGAGVLVIAGAALGLAFVWRGDRLTRSVPAFGQALIGIGLGIVYLSLYLGHFTLRVLDVSAAFSLLTATSLITVAIGLRYRAPSIAGLGVLGAFLPELLAVGMPLRGFSMPAAGALAYFAVVDLAVFLLAARAGWGGIELLALGFTTFTWLSNFATFHWGWGVEMGLVGLYVVLGLAILPRLVALRDRVRPAELAVVALAPMLLVAVSWPFLAFILPTSSAMLLMMLAVVYLLAALWIEPRRTEEDLWRPLTAAATIFLAAALERATGVEGVAMAWAFEGLALVWIGSRGPRTWLRVCGYAIGALGGLWLMGTWTLNDMWRGGAHPLFDAAGARDLATLVALLLISILSARAARGARESTEEVVARMWTVGVNLLFVVWSAQVAPRAAALLSGEAGPPARMLAAGLTSGAWTVQAAILVALGWRQGSAFLRWLGLALLGLTVLKFLIGDLQQVDVFWRFLSAVAVGVVLLAVSYVYQRRVRNSGAGG